MRIIFCVFDGAKSLKGIKGINDKPLAFLETFIREFCPNAKD